MANQAVLEKFLSDSAYVKELLATETPEEVQASLNAKGADITLEEVKAVAGILSRKSGGELSEDDLEDVAGGSTQLTLKMAPTLLDTLFKLPVTSLRNRW